MRAVRDLQSQIDRRDKQNNQLSEDIAKSRDKIERLLATIEELQADDSKHELAARRAERELKTEREEKLRLERELEGWKSLRVERGLLGSVAGRGSETGSVRESSASYRGSSLMATTTTGVGSLRGSGAASGLMRKPSNTKGFL